MTSEEKFIFDLEGYIAIRNVLSDSEVERMNQEVDEAFPANGDDSNFRRTSKVSQWGPSFQALMDHPKIMPYLLELLGPKVRIDHDYCIFMTEGGQAGRLHGGETDRAPDHWYKYRDGVMRNGLMSCTFFLTHANDGDGGFACIPGSHKCNFVDSLPEDVQYYKRMPHYVRQPAVESGDVLIFTEALIHGTIPWTAKHERRALLYKYSPGNSAWSQDYYNAEEYPNLTVQQQRLIASPSVGNRPNTVTTE